MRRLREASPPSPRSIERDSISAAHMLGFGFESFSVFQGLEDETDPERFRERLQQYAGEHPTENTFRYVAALRNVAGLQWAPEVLRGWLQDETHTPKSREFAHAALAECQPEASAGHRVHREVKDVRTKIRQAVGAES